ncbi:MAG: YdeI/OmpD-associated family protein [Bacteroidota bacterium]|nr:YdeI/OmpD-associated family protein [Bacteroidota bacterium]MDP4230131.1 YdeI/OmpD-associated family protein [Bacteroidota bacterium]MDP4237282.1 YdeI/OmpD-associated family protein [Bacteroidota bacterium]
MELPTPIFFSSAAEFRHWLKHHHSSAKEVCVGFYKRHTGKATLSWKESVDEALAVGWIDGVRKGLDVDRYQIRFSPRRAGSIWSAVNIRRVNELTLLGRMQPAGLKVFENRDPRKVDRYSFERQSIAFSSAEGKKFRANRKAWSYFQAMPPSYQKPATWWVISATRQSTRERRLATLICDSELGKKIKVLSYNKSTTKQA